MCECDDGGDVYLRERWVGEGVVHFSLLTRTLQKGSWKEELKECFLTLMSSFYAFNIYKNYFKKDS